MAAAEPRQRLLLLGGGHAHLALLQRLAVARPAGWAVTLVSPHPRLLYSGRLPAWVAGRVALEACAISLVELTARAGIAFHQTAAVSLDLGRNDVACADGSRVPFDLLSIDTGPEPANGGRNGTEGLEGAAAHALPVRPIEGFVRGWPGLMARWRSSPARFDVAVIGSGAAAIEIAFAVQASAAREGATQVRVSLIGRDAAPLHGMASGARDAVQRALAARGIGWHGGRSAARVRAGSVVFDDGAEIGFDACIVATGAAAPRWPGAAGLATDERGFIRVDRTLRSVSHPQVFAAGDVAAYADARPKSGVFAVRAGPVLADNLLAACAGAPLRAWQPQRRALYLISTADDCAIAAWGKWSASGRWAGWWKDRIDRRFVESFNA